MGVANGAKTRGSENVGCSRMIRVWLSSLHLLLLLLPVYASGHTHTYFQCGGWCAEATGTWTRVGSYVARYRSPYWRWCSMARCLICFLGWVGY
ncbi:hypothetical protein F4782DRAFT_488130 [Xylaria castorea]|nr:hypothetical protein F4782DRAFT_488130 [Xylaria castorea]